MKQTLLITFLLAFNLSLFAQQAIAKIKYEEAEEAYAANNFKTTLSKLIEAETILNTTNPRILYLKIMAQSKILEQNVFAEEYSFLESLRRTTDKYLKEYENLPDNDDKYRDIYKVSEQLKKYPANQDEFIKRKKDLSDEVDYYRIVAAGIAAKDYVNTIEIAKKYLFAYPNKPQPYAFLRKAAIGLDLDGSKGLAVPYFNLMDSLLEKDIDKNRKSLYSNYTYLLFYYEEKAKDYNKAIEVLDKIIAIYPYPCEENRVAKDTKERLKKM